jgi:hypothetical protein
MLSNILKVIWMITDFIIWEKDNLLRIFGLHQVEGHPIPLTLTK